MDIHYGVLHLSMLIINKNAHNKVNKFVQIL